MSKNFNFTETDKSRIKEAVEKIEKVSSGEVVVYFAQQSDDYQESRWFAASFFMFVGAMILAVLSYQWLLPFALTPFQTVLVILGFFLLGYSIVWLFPACIRLVSTDERLHTVTYQKAAAVFLNREVFNTRDRTGILIYTSYLEHKVHLLADKGISEVITSEKWEEVLNSILQGIKSGNITDGLVKGIALLEKPLLEHGIHIKPDDKNELSDDIIIEQ